VTGSLSVLHGGSGSWDPQVRYDKKTIVGGWEAAASDAEGDFGTGDVFKVNRAGINAWSNNGMWGNNTFFFSRVYGQNMAAGSYSSSQLPRTGGSGDDHYFGWDTDINVVVLSGLTYRGTYVLDYYYQYRDGDGTHDTGHYYPTFVSAHA